ncbi:MAG: ATP-binding cassette domain-containing protein [bacterium]
MSSYSNNIILEFRDVSYLCGNTDILSGVSFTLEKGAAMVIGGECGNGKTTFLKLCCGLLFPDKGEVLIKGQNTQKIGHKELLELRKDIGYVFQDSALLSNQTIFMNIALPLRYHRIMEEGKINKAVQEQIKLVGVERYKNLRPAALATGYKKRAAIARALTMNPGIIFYDEPFSGLDPHNAKAVKEIIHSMHRGFGVTTVMAVNGINIALDLADKIAILHESKFIFCGSLEDLKKSENNFIREFVKPS